MKRGTKLTKRGRTKLPKEKRYAPLVVIMPPADIKLLTEEAERRGINRSELIRGMIENEMKTIRKANRQE